MEIVALTILGQRTGHHLQRLPHHLRRVQVHLGLAGRHLRRRVVRSRARKNFGHRSSEPAPDFDQDPGDAAAAAVGADRGEAAPVGQVVGGVVSPRQRGGRPERLHRAVRASKVKKYKKTIF